MQLMRPSQAHCWPTHPSALPRACCSYLLDRANLLLFLHQAHSGTDSSGRRWQQSQQQRLLSLAEAHDLMLATGVSMDRYLVFCKLLRAGYIVQRHPARWLLRPGEGPVQAWAGWGQAPAMAAGGKQQQVCGARSAVVQQCQQQQVQQQQPLAAARAGSTVPTPPAALPAGRTPKRPKVQPQQQRSGTWWVAGPASVQQQQQGQLHDVHSSSANPWLRCLPANFLDSLPRCTVLPDAAQRARAAFPCMAPLQAIPLAELQPPTGPSGGHHLLVSEVHASVLAVMPTAPDTFLNACREDSSTSSSHPPPPQLQHPALQHYDVFNSNSRFSRKAPGNPAFVVSVLPCTALPTPQDMSAADAAADGVPVRFSTIEKGDICYYGLAHVELRSILPS